MCSRHCITTAIKRSNVDGTDKCSESILRGWGVFWHNQRKLDCDHCSKEGRGKLVKVYRNMLINMVPPPGVEPGTY